MRSKRIEFIIGGLSIPGVGMSVAGKEVEVEPDVAQSLIDQGIAKAKETAKITKKKEKESK
jgi:hypothetical protein|tara:strand:+ start:487 stop:669 length:183 start_codon:yes stop_codon:yes gene_type:complete